MMKKVWWVVLAAAAASGCFMKKSEFTAYSLASAKFSVEYPAGWTVIENEAGFNPGVMFLAPPPQGKRAVRRSLTVDFYPKGNTQYSSIEDYVSSHTRPGPDRSSEPLKPAAVAGIAGQELVYRKPLPQSPEFAPKGTLVTKVRLFAANDGFFALADAVPEGSPADEGGAFAKLTASFKLAK
ncbi:MAG: hypothetical protein HY924_16925 [Elusimicrobia bacterium]|nr:hypothetical protein [Elusimicrobiota bacterium]